MQDRQEERENGSIPLEAGVQSQLFTGSLSLKARQIQEQILARRAATQKNGGG